MHANLLTSVLAMPFILIYAGVRTLLDRWERRRG